jgi:uncharacterized membrane protein YozB (DUF420 family)
MEVIAARPEPPRAGFRAHPADHSFFSAMAIVCPAVILTGFASSYLPKLSRGTPVPPIVHLHAVVFTTWLGLNLAQTLLVGRGRIAIHRRLGTASALFSILMLAVGLETAVTVARLGDHGLPQLPMPDPETFLLLNVSSIVVFMVFVATGWAFRKQRETHKRLMLLATVSLMPPGVGRLPVISEHVPAIALTLLAFLASGPIYDLLTRRKVHPAYLLGAVLILGPAPPVLVSLGATAAWRSAAAWLIGG